MMEVHIKSSNYIPRLTLVVQKWVERTKILGIQPSYYLRSLFLNSLGDSPLQFSFFQVTFQGRPSVFASRGFLAIQVLSLANSNLLQVNFGGAMDYFGGVCFGDVVGWRTGK